MQDARWLQQMDAAIFDVDGTLLDSNDAHVDSWASALRAHELPAEHDHIAHLIGMGSDKVIPALAHVNEDSALGRAIAKAKREAFATRLAHLRPTPGARALLEHLRAHGVAVGVATSAGEDELHELLAQAGVADLIPVRTSKDDARESKPAADIVEAALHRLGARPARTVMVGDTPYDLESAARAGVASIALRCGRYWADAELAGARLIADDPAALLATWRAIGDRD